MKQQAFNEQTREHMAELATKHAKHSTKVVTIIALILGFFLLLSMGVNAALIYGVVSTQITTVANPAETGARMEVKGSGGQIAQVAVATESMALVYAPLLSLEQIAEVKELVVTVPINVSDASAGSMKLGLSVAGFGWYSKTTMYFKAATGEKVVINDGMALLIADAENRMWKPLCSANATCSAFRASGDFDLEALDAALDAELAARRRLDGTEGKTDDKTKMPPEVRDGTEGEAKKDDCKEARVYFGEHGNDLTALNGFSYILHPRGAFWLMDDYAW